jgi:hypothetical protein
MQPQEHGQLRIVASTNRAGKLVTGCSFQQLCAKGAACVRPISLRCVLQYPANALVHRPILLKYVADEGIKVGQCQSWLWAKSLSSYGAGWLVVC